jgi:hypothetical protein
MLAQLGDAATLAQSFRDAQAPIGCPELRAEFLRSCGYGVISVIGNEAAKFLLSPIQHYDLFIVDHAAPQEIRIEIAAWLKANHPKVAILALNPPGQQVPAADYNVPHAPENWLPIVSTVCERRLSASA